MNAVKREAALLAAAGEHAKNVEERPRGSNAGPRVEEYLRSTGLGKGFPWCAAFVTWCYRHVDGLPSGFAGSAAVRVWASWAERTNRDRKDPARGRLFYQLDPKTGLGHIGFVAGLLPGGFFRTIEGNTNEGGSREGYKVARRVRHRSKVRGFIEV